MLCEVAISSKVLIAKRTLEVDLGFRVALRSLRAGPTFPMGLGHAEEYEGSMELVIEHGSTVSEADPATTGRNLKGIVWDATPIHAHLILLTTDVTTHQFGDCIASAANGDLSASTIYYGAAGPRPPCRPAQTSCYVPGCAGSISRAASATRAGSFCCRVLIRHLRTLRY